MINNDWDEILKNEYKKEYFTKIQDYLNKASEKTTIFPKKDDIYKAFQETSYQNTRIVILGQDPYHDDNQANGLAFSVSEGVKIPPSLMNIYKEIDQEFSCGIPSSGDLSSWAKQGVLLLNSTLTVEAHKANSHQNIGWKNFTDSVISSLNERKTPVVFIFWGNNAIKKEKLITNPTHLVLKSAHPSPLSAYRGFFGNNHFENANKFLQNNNYQPINWKINTK